MTKAKEVKQKSFWEKSVIRWHTLTEGRVLLESYISCSLLPVLLFILPEWVMVSNGRVHRGGLVDYSMGLGAILFAPIFETIFIFVPVLEVCRYFKVKPAWTILGFALFFELLHTQRGFFGLLLLILPGIYLGARLALFPAFIMLEEKGVIDSLKLSW